VQIHHDQGQHQQAQVDLARVARQKRDQHIFKGSGTDWASGVHMSIPPDFQIVLIT
jgi:hypothetical protein